MHFEWPLLFVLLPLPLLVYFLLPALKTSAAALYMPGLNNNMFNNQQSSTASPSRFHRLLLALILTNTPKLWACRPES